MALTKRDESKFDSLCDAAQQGKLVLMECKDRATGEYRAVICIQNKTPDGGAAVEPLGHLVNGNPFEQYVPPGDPEELVIPAKKH